MKFDQLITNLRDLDRSLKDRAIKVVNVGLSARNWLVGAYLIARPDFALPVSDLIQKLTFSHFVELLRVDDPLKRAFYEMECVKGGWSVRELKRQMGSLLFERLGLSTDKEKLLRLTADEASAPAQPADIIKDPYIFEFLGLTPQEAFRENDLETALLDHLQEFLLGLKYALGGMDKNLFISSYQVALPSKEELEAFIIQHS